MKCCVLIKTKLVHSEQITSSQPRFQAWEVLLCARGTACKQGTASASNNRWVYQKNDPSTQSGGEEEKRETTFLSLLVTHDYSLLSREVN